MSIKNSTELRGHTGPIERVAWNPTKEAELASCSADGTVRFWDVRTKNCNAEVKLGGEGFTVTWSPDGTNVVAGRKVSLSQRHSFRCLLVAHIVLGRHHRPDLSERWHGDCGSAPLSDRSDEPDHLLALGPGASLDDRHRSGEDPVLS